MTEAETIRNVIIPSQYVGKWTNDSGVKLRVFQVIDIDSLELIKCFVPAVEFKMLNLAQYLRGGAKKRIFVLGFSEDDEGRENLVSLTEAETFTFALDSKSVTK